MRFLCKLLTAIVVVCWLPSMASGQCSNPPQISVAIDKSCPGLNQGTVTITVTGGSAATSINLTDANNVTSVAASGVALNLPSGTYTLEIEYADNVSGDPCSENYPNVVISDFDPIVLNVPAQQSACYLADLTLAGSVTSGGEGTLGYVWKDPSNNTVTGGIIDDAVPADNGTYTLTVTDAEGCAASATTDVTIGTQITATAVNDGLCPNNTLTLAATDINGGTAPYTFAWSGPNGFSSNDSAATISSATAAQNGSYVLTVTDAAGCSNLNQISTAVSILTPVTVTAQVDSTYCDGATIQLSATANGGGGSNYTYSWTNSSGDPVVGGTISAATANESGKYAVVATDGNGCSSAADTVQITVDSAITATAGIDSTYCPGMTITLSGSATGGAGGYSYAWTGPNFTAATANPQVTDNAAPAHAGAYSLEVTDARGCTSNVPVTNIGVDSLIIAVTGNDSSYCHDATITLSGSATGGSGNYSYSWSGPGGYTSGDQNPEILNGTSSRSGNYILVVSDERCSSAPDTTVVTVSTPVVPVAANDTTYCHGADVTLLATASGGAGGYTYSWTNSSEEPVAGGTIAAATTAESGSYFVKATDADGCFGVDTTTITVLAVIVAAGPEDTSYCSGDTIRLSATASGGSGSYASFAWSGPGGYTAGGADPTIPDAGASHVGTYRVVVTDDLGCKSDTEDVAVNVYDPIVVAASNNGLCHGADVNFSYNHTGGLGDLNFAWSGPGGYTSADEFPVIAEATAANNGNYTLVITDDKGCVSNTAATSLVVTTPVTASAVANNASCPGVAITFSANAAGGTAPYTYIWTNVNGDTIAGGQIAAPVLADEGDYTLVVTDANQCASISYASTVAFYETPTAEASNYQSVTIASDSLHFSFDRGDGDGVLVLVSEGAPASTSPSCGAVYASQEDSVISFSGVPALGNARIVYNSLQSPSTVELVVTGLDFNTQYYYTVYEYDTSINGTSYLTTAVLTGSETTLHTPSGLASNLRFENIGNESLKARWTNGNGQGRIVVVQVNDSLISGSAPVDGTSYTGNPVPGQGDSLSTGLYVVYNGTDSTVDLTGLASFGLYTIGIYEYNGSGSNIKYSAVTEMPVRTSATIASNVTKYSIQIRFTNPNKERGVLVLAKPLSAISGVPVDGVEYQSSYNKNVSFDTASVPKVGDAYAVFRDRNREGDGNPRYYTLNLLDLTSDVPYYFEIYEWDTLTNTYYYHPELDLDTATLLGAPSLAAKRLRVDNVTETSMRINWGNGNGSRRIVVLKPKLTNTGLVAKPADSTTYAHSTVFAAGDSLSYPGATAYSGTHYIVYNGADSFVTVTGLSPLTSYYVGVIEYNGNNGFENYRSSYTYMTATTAGIRVSNVTPKKLTATFTHGNGKGAIVLVREGAPIGTDPVDGTNYTAPMHNSAAALTVSFLADTLSTIGGARVVYKGSAGNLTTRSVTVTDLKSSIDYYIAAYEWDTAGNLYTLSTKLLIDTTTALTAPNTVAKNISFENVGATSMKIKWTNGNGNNRIVVLKAATTINTAPADSTIYSASDIFGSGDTLAGSTSGRHYVVYNGPDSSVTVTNLAANTMYYVRIFEYNGTTVTDYGSGSPIGSRRTNMDFVVLKKEGQAYSQDFDSLAITGGLPAGWHSEDAAIADNTGSDGTEGVFSFGGGSYPASDRSLGSIGGNRFGVKIRNNTGKVITSILVRYKGIQWRKGGASTQADPDRLIVQYSTDAYSLTGANQYLSNTPATWTDATTNTLNNNTNINFYSLSAGAGAASLNVAGMLPSATRSASITGLNLAANQTIWIRFSDLDIAGNDDALAIDSLEIVPFVNTYVGGGTLATANLGDLNVVGGTLVQSVGTVSVSNAMNLENGSVYDLSGSATRNLKVGGRIYSDNSSGNGSFSTGSLSNINVAGNEGHNNLYFTTGANTVRNLTLSSGASASIMSAVSINGGAQYGAVNVGSATSSSTLYTNGLLTLKSDTTGSAAINPVYGSVIGDVTIERAMTYKAGNRIMAHPFSGNIPLSQLHDDITLDVSGGSGQNVWNFDAATTSATAAGSLVSTSSWEAYQNLSDNWEEAGALRIYKAAGAGKLDVTGSINQGTYPVMISGEPGSLAIIGNPYPSGVKLGAALTAAAGIADTVWTYNLVTNSFKATAASGWSALSLPMFGIVVVKLTGNSGLITFQESYKLASPSTATVYRGDNDEEISVDPAQAADFGTGSMLRLTLAPNPASEEVTLYTGEGLEGKAVVRVFSMTGQLMKELSFELQSARLTMSLTDLPEGMYIVELITDNEKATRQLMKL